MRRTFDANLASEPSATRRTNSSAKLASPTVRSRRELYEDELEFSSFELGDGSELDVDDPDVGFALAMSNPRS